MFALWCNNPVNTTHRVNLKDAMQLHELMSYMKHAIPLDPPSTPEAAPAA